MSYILLGQSLHETADRAKKYFAKTYGAKSFQCETDLKADLPLRPTWQATTNAGYRLCIEVRETPFSNSLYQFVSECATRGMPVRLWVAVPQGMGAANFSTELRQAHDAGVGVVQIAEDGSGHEVHRPVPLSLFALKKTDIQRVPKSRREEIKNAESTFLDGAPDHGCQEICAALESLTRAFGEYTFGQGWWQQPSGANVPNTKFFQKDPWSNMLQIMETRIDVGQVKGKSPSFTKQAIVKARSHTDWRNSVSHKPKSLRQLRDRDAKLRTMFEATRDLLLEWYEIGKPLKLI